MTKSEVYTISGFEMTQANGENDHSKSRGDKGTRVYEQYVQPCVAEFLGSVLLMFVGCASVVGNVLPSAIQPALAHGLVISVIVLLFGPISGGHSNPAVTLSVYLCGGMSLPLVVPYFLVQMLGSMAGAGLVEAVFNPDEYHNGTGGAFSPETLNKDPGKMMLAEFLMTMILTTIVIMAAVNEKTSSPMAPFCIGVAVVAIVLAGEKLSGACMNPVRAFGPAVLANKWDHHWIYWVGPMTGALGTVVLVRLFLGDRKTRLILRK